jgi:hypothetical protein
LATIILQRVTRFLYLHSPILRNDYPDPFHKIGIKTRSAVPLSSLPLTK